MRVFLICICLAGCLLTGSTSSVVKPFQCKEMLSKDTITSDMVRCDTVFPLDYGTYRDSVTDNMFTKWQRTEFPRICKKNKMPKISCAGCTTISVDVQIAVGNNGKVLFVKVLEGRACGRAPSEAFKRDICTSVSKLVFPKQCNNACFKKRLGRALKC